MGKATVVAVLILCSAAGCGSARDAAQDATRPTSRLPAVVGRGEHAVTVRFGPGRQTIAFPMLRRRGVVLLYRLRAAVGMDVRATAQLRGVSAPLGIAARPAGPIGCLRRRGRMVCVTSVEWCPMPRGAWRIDLTKRAGPAGMVTLWFQVGVPEDRA